MLPFCDRVLVRRSAKIIIKYNEIDNVWLAAKLKSDDHSV